MPRSLRTRIAASASSRCPLLTRRASQTSCNSLPINDIYRSGTDMCGIRRSSSRFSLRRFRQTAHAVPGFWPLQGV